MLLEVINPQEIVVGVRTRNKAFHVLVEIRHDTDIGFWYCSTYYEPHTNNRIRKASFPPKEAIELSHLVDADFRYYINANKASLLGAV